MGAAALPLMVAGQMVGGAAKAQNQPALGPPTNFNVPMMPPVQPTPPMSAQQSPLILPNYRRQAQAANAPSPASMPAPAATTVSGGPYDPTSAMPMPDQPYYA